MTPEQAHFLLNEVYIPQIENEHKTTRRVIEAVPADKGDFAPHPTSMPAWKLASHIASSEMFFMNGTANGSFDRADGAIPESVKTPAELVKWYDEAHHKAVAKLKAAKAEDLAKNVTFAVFTLPAIAYTGLMLSHSAHHRGQLSAYLRPMGAKVPRIYGGSADEPIEMPAQAQAQA
jgi:uncharacterized damage-inducible protein DinB